MTSLTVPPWASFTGFRSASSAWVIWKRRCGPISTLKGVAGARRAGGALFVGAAAPGARPAQRRAEAADDLLRAGQPLLQRVAEQLRVGRLGPGQPRGRRGGRTLRFAVEVVEDGGDVDAGDAVDQRVVALADHGEAAVGHALDQPELPEGLRAVELLGEDPRRQVAQLLVGAGRRQRGLPHVVVEGEVGVVG